MKKIYTLFLALIITGCLMAQTPQSFKYQAVARDASGEVIADQKVSFQFSILEGSTSGTAVYIEQHTDTTNQFGLVNLEIGDGSVLTGDFTSIGWANNTFFLKVELNGTHIGTSQLLSVPYALHAKTAANTFSGNYSDLNGIPSNVSTFTNDAGYLTSITETDPIFGAHAANGIGSTNITNWTTAYGWGNHSTVGYTTTDTTLNETEVDYFVANNGYLTSYTEADPVFGDWDKSTGISITESQITNLDHFTTADETDPVFETHPSYGIGSTNITNWTTAFGWGDHSTVGYFAAGGEAGGTNRTLGNTDDYSLGFKTNDATRLFITNDGNVGIGTTAPESALHIRGTTQRWIKIEGTDADASDLQMWFKNATKEYSVGLNTGTVGNDKFSIYDHSLSAHRFLIDASGNVGIGTTSPLTKLHIMETGVPNFARLTIQSTDDGAGIRLKSDVGYHCYLDFSDGDSDYVGRIYYSHNDDQMRFRTAGSDAMTINSAGNVGIGTTSPSTELDVNGVVTANGGDSDDWNTAFVWGDHSVEGYLTSFIELDPAYTTSEAAYITATDITNLSNLSGTNTGDQDGSETKVTAGTNVTVIGEGTAGSPYIVNATAATPLAIGDSYQGGIIFWLDATGQHGLIAAIGDQNTGIQWYNGSSTTTGATLDAVYAGKANTDIIITNQGAGSYAAQVCADYSVTINNEYYGDWYLPSKYELNLLYLQRVAVGDFASNYYWSSTESNLDDAWGRNCSNGYQVNYSKGNELYVRAVRAF